MNQDDLRQSSMTTMIEYQAAVLNFSMDTFYTESVQSVSHTSKLIHFLQGLYRSERLSRTLLRNLGFKADLLLKLYSTPFSTSPLYLTLHTSFLFAACVEVIRKFDQRVFTYRDCHQIWSQVMWHDWQQDIFENGSFPSTKNFVKSRQREDISIWLLWQEQK